MIGVTDPEPVEGLAAVGAFERSEDGSDDHLNFSIDVTPSVGMAHDRPIISPPL
jgi:hypothetical protein